MKLIILKKLNAYEIETRNPYKTVVEDVTVLKAMIVCQVESKKKLSLVVHLTDPVDEKQVRAPFMIYADDTKWRSDNLRGGED